MTICGIKEIINKLIIMMIKNGTIPFKITSIGEFDILEATNKLMPSGGVVKPIARFTTIIKPK